MFRHVIWPVLGVRTASLPPAFAPGTVVTGRLLFFGLMPAWTHRITIDAVGSRELVTREGGGPVRAWNHTLTFEPLAADRCRYTDAVEIRAGLATWPTVAFAHALYRWRQHRWRRLARALQLAGAVPNAPSAATDGADGEGR